MGSCKFDLQRLLDHVKDQEGKHGCENYFPGNGCHLPMKRGPAIYGTSKGAIPVKFPIDLPKNITNFLPYKVDIQLIIAANGTEIVCLRTKIDIASE